MITGKLTVTALTRLKPGMKIGDGGGLWITCKTRSSAHWSFRYKHGGKSHEAGLGSYPDISASAARELAAQFRAILREGRDPLVERSTARAAARVSKVMTFREATDRLLSFKSSEWRNEKHKAQWRSTLERFAFTILGDMDVREIRAEHVLQVLEADDLWTTKPETASRLRQRIESVLDMAIALEKRSPDNPARLKGNLGKILPKTSKIKQVKHHAAIEYSDLPDFMVELVKQQGISALALQFLILTAARTGEIIGARWSEIEGSAWTIPPERMKAAKLHRVPLSTQAVAILEKVPRIEGSDFIFHGSRNGQPLSTAAMSALLQRRMGRTDLTIHGFRAVFKTWASEQTAFARELIEISLAHKVWNDTEQAYQRGDLMVRRSKLMQAWSDFACTPKQPADVVPLQGRKRNAQ